MSMSIGPNQGDRQKPDNQALRGMLRIGVAVLIVAAAVASACIVMVPEGQAEVITRFGNPTRVITEPGLAWEAARAGGDLNSNRLASSHDLDRG